MPITGLLRSITATTGRRRTMAAGAGATGTAIGCAEIRRGLPTRSAVKFLGIAIHRIGSIYSPAPSQEQHTSNLRMRLWVTARSSRYQS